MNNSPDPNVTVDLPLAPTDSLAARPASGMGRPRSSLGATRPVLLRDVQGESDLAVKFRSDAMPSPSEAGDRYELSGEIARGGMGAVLRGRDVELGRDLAVKVLLDKHADRPEVTRRFLEEAQIGGQLQHPGVVPVYDIGRFGKRPFFTMKLVKGRTLAALLVERDASAAHAPDSATNRPRLLHIAHQVAQTVAYAHAKGVIHRDLKPANIMVGAFGEVQVMDWGLAKVLTDGGGAGERRFGRSGEQTGEETAIRTARSTGSAEGAGTETEAGSLLGTPAYMPPEQATGDIANLDRRADVFGLGAILCEILTGKPPYVGRSVDDVRYKAALGDLADAQARLDACGADAELLALTRGCLAVNAGDRPKDAGEVAAAIAGYLTGVEERARRTELQRAAAEVRAAEERKRRQTQLALAASLLVLVTAAAGGVLWQQRQQAEQATAAARREETQRQNVLAGLAKVEDLGSRARWPEARAILEETSGRLGAEAPADLRQRLDEARADVDLVGLLEQARMHTANWKAHGFDNLSAGPAYTRALRNAGLIGDDQETASAAAAAAAKIRDCRVRDAVVAALDDLTSMVEEGEWRAWLLEVTRLADPHPWRDRFRAPGLRQTRQELRLLTADLKAGEHSPQFLVATATTLGLGADAVPVLEAAQRCYPGDFWINYWLGYSLWAAERSADAIGYYRAAIALRPQGTAAYNNLGIALNAVGRAEDAVAAYGQALALDSQLAPALNNLAVVLLQLERVDEALAAAHKAIALAPELAPAHTNLGNALRRKGQVDDALAAYAHALTLDRKDPKIHFGRAQTLDQMNRIDEAITAYWQGLRLDPKNAEALNNLGALLCDKKHAYEEAAAVFRKALELAPTLAKTHCNLGNALQAGGHSEDAVVAYRRSLELDPKNASTHTNLGTTLHQLARLKEAIAAHRQAVALEPKNANALTCLGNALRQVNELEEAIAVFQKALDIDPRLPNAHGARGQALLLMGRFAEAREASQHALDLLPMNHSLRPFAQRQLDQCERFLALEKRLPDLLAGRQKVANAAEALNLAEMCAQRKQLHAAATRFYDAAFAADAKLADNLKDGHRYNAACAAALAAAGQGKGEPPHDGPAAAKLRRQALDWLRADLTAWSKLLESGPADARPTIAQTLRHWQEDSDIAGIRDAAALAKLPADERAAFIKLWADVASLLEKANASN